MTSDPTFDDLNTLDGELLPERTVLSGIDLTNLVSPAARAALRWTLFPFDI